MQKSLTMYHIHALMLNSVNITTTDTILSVYIYIYIYSYCTYWKNITSKFNKINTFTCIMYSL